MKSYVKETRDQSWCKADKPDYFNLLWAILTGDATLQMELF